MMHAHAHGPQEVGVGAQRRLALVLGISFTLMVVEAIGGLATGSLTLLADAGHMLSDVGALGLALFAAWFASRPSPARNTFGYQRIEILAALINAVLLALVLLFVLREAVLRLRQPPELDVGPMALLGLLGLTGNLVSARLLHRHSQGSLNVRGAYLEVLADLLASVGVLAAAACAHWFGWRHADPLISLGIALFIVPRIWLLLREVTDVLMENAPRGLDMDALREALLAEPAVRTVHDLHVWAITPNRVCLSAHLVGERDADRDRLIVAVNRMLQERFGVGHTTLQVEGADHPAFSGQTSEEACDPCAAPEVATPGAQPEAQRGRQPRG